MNSIITVVQCLALFLVAVATTTAGYTVTAEQSVSAAVPQPAAAALDEATVQGLYEGSFSENGNTERIEARLVACGKGTYKLFIRQPLEAKQQRIKAQLDGKAEGQAINLTGNTSAGPWSAVYRQGLLSGTGTIDASGKPGKFELRRVVRTSPTLGAAPPQGAIVLLDGKNFDALTKGRLRDGSEQQWQVGEDGGVLIPRGGMRTKAQFAGSFKLHVEFKCPLRPEARGQGRGNSGVYLPNGDEIQVLDSFGMTTYKGGGCGGLYAYKDPDAFDEFSLASAPPLQWQTFDIEYRVQQKDGKPMGKPRVTVWHNGIKIHDDVEVNHAAKVGGIFFQDHGNPVEYRNIWLLPLDGQ